MGNTIISLPTNRTSLQSVRQTLLNNINYSNTQMSLLDQEISSGQQYQLPSENPIAAAQVLNLQTLASQNQQYQSNVTISQSYMNETDSVLSSLNSQLTSVQSTVLSAVGTTATPPRNGRLQSLRYSKPFSNW